MNLSVAQALRADSAPCIAFVGAGGKTTALFKLARQLPSPVIVTATSHLGSWQFSLADSHILTNSPAPLEKLEHGLQGVILITGKMDGDRSNPVDESLLQWLNQFCGYHSIPLLIEADGSKQRPLKSWAEHEPPIPDFVRHIVHVTGLSGLGKPLNENFVHRPEIFSKISGLQTGEIVTPGAIIRVLTEGQGGLKNIPDHARKTVLMNQADSDELQSTANRMVRPLLSTFDSVIISNLREEKIYAVYEHIAGIILAAGESTRYGRVKQLLDWRGQPFIRVIAQTALEAGLSPVVVITGANAEIIEAAVKDLEVRVVFNPDWKRGQGSSIKAGVEALGSPPRLPHLQRQNLLSKSPISNGGFEGGAIFLLADQPQVTTSVIRALVEKHAEGLYPIIAPMVIDRRANPVLFDRSTFADLLTIEGDVGGRAIFHRHRVEYLPWHDDRLLLDVDTPEMYQRLISDETL
jgi:molybdenum cofactor cytidylyltransferase